MRSAVGDFQRVSNVEPGKCEKESSGSFSAFTKSSSLNIKRRDFSRDMEAVVVGRKGGEKGKSNPIGMYGVILSYFFFPKPGLSLSLFFFSLPF